MQQKKEVVILGIDPGTHVTGYGLIKMKSHTHEIIDFGAIRPPAHIKNHNRYLIIFNALEHLIEKFQPNAIAVESQFVYKNAQSALKLGIAKGMVILAAAKQDIPLFEYAPKKAKMAVVGNGAASKEQVQKM